MTKVIVETVSSETDVNGNRYHFARFYNPAKGRGISVVMEVGSENNATHMAYKLAGEDWEAILCFKSTLPKRQWKRCRDVAMGSAKVTGLYEGSLEANAALKALFA